MKRDITIDIVKGIGIFLVVLGHIVSYDLANKFIYSFHMPLFFFISGITLYFSYKENIKFREFITKRGRTILISYFIFSIISFVYWFFIERKIRGQYDISALDNFANIFLAFGKNDLFSPNVVMWFLPCLLMSFIIFYFLMKIKKARSIIVIILLIIGFILSYFNIVLPWTLEIALIGVFFLYTGYLYKKNNLENYVFRWIPVTLFGSIILVFICSFYNTSVAMLNGDYGNHLLFLLGAYAGIFMILGISKLLSKLNSKNVIVKTLCFLGKNSIIIMACHEPLKRIILKVSSVILNINIDLMRENITYSILNTIIILIILTPVIIIINKYLPFIIGKKNKFKVE